MQGQGDKGGEKEKEEPKYEAPEGLVFELLLSALATCDLKFLDLTRVQV